MAMTQPEPIHQEQLATVGVVADRTRARGVFITRVERQRFGQVNGDTLWLIPD